MDNGPIIAMLFSGILLAVAVIRGIEFDTEDMYVSKWWLRAASVSVSLLIIGVSTILFSHCGDRLFNYENQSSLIALLYASGIVIGICGIVVGFIGAVVLTLIDRQELLSRLYRVPISR